MKEICTKDVCLIINETREADIPEYLFDTKPVLEFHKKIKGYEPTPLVSLENYAQKIGVKKVYVKDESSRFGL